MIRRQMGDVNFDGTINIFDTNYIGTNWGGYGPAGDANDDGTVNIFDQTTYGTQKIDIYEGTTLKASYDEIGGSAISLICNSLADGS